MPLGYCAHCDTLRSIRKLRLKLGSRECDWGAIEHAEPSRHKGCGGIVYAIEPEPLACCASDAGALACPTSMGRYRCWSGCGCTKRPTIITCELCETALHEHEIDRGKPSCPGVGKVIR